MEMSPLKWWKCVSCGNKGLCEIRPTTCHDKCESPNFKLLKHQEAYEVGKADYVDDRDKL
jgi:hypothetical protein